MTYTINANAFDKVNKAFNRYAKKAAKVGLECTLNVINTYPKEVTVWANDDITHTTYKVGTTVIDVMDIEIVFPDYKLGDYRVVAVLEHLEDGKNIVYNCGDYEVPAKYQTAKGICEHCGTNHNRVKTVVLQDVLTEEYKQVGTGCLKEYTGVTDIDLVNAYKALECIVLENETERDYFGPITHNYDETGYFLTKCIHLYNEIGYTKQNKYKADEVRDNDITDTDRKLAEDTIEFFETHEFDDTFLNNIKNIITQTYCKPNNGFVAYAYVAYIKEAERLNEKAKEAAEKAEITYYGTVGDKVKGIEVTGRCIAGYDTQFGYTYIYKFTDNNNHVFIWRTGNSIDTNDEGTFTGTINGTIKAHDEYANEKQTVLTRCKTFYKEMA